MPSGYIVFSDDETFDYVVKLENDLSLAYSENEKLKAEIEKLENDLHNYVVYGDTVYREKIELKFKIGDLVKALESIAKRDPVLCYECGGGEWIINEAKEYLAKIKVTE
jgi:hypothetical protein